MDASIRVVLREGRVTNYELTALSKDGRMTVVSFNASTFLDADSKLQGVFAAARDITEQKKLEQQLRDSEAYNRGLIEASLDGLITVAPDGNITDINEQMARISGYPREELLGTPFADYFSDPDDATKGVNETFEKGTVTDYVLTLVTLDKRQRGVSFNATVFRDPFGEIKGIFASARDITEQAQLQSQLAEERAYNRGLIEASLDGLITVDPLLNITDVGSVKYLGNGEPISSARVKTRHPAHRLERFVGADGRKRDDLAAAAHPMGRLGAVDEVVSAVLYLLSDAAGFTTGFRCQLMVAGPRGDSG